MTEIRTERLHLRHATMSDLAAFHGILTNPKAMAYWSTPPHDQLEQTRAWLNAMVEIPSGQGEDFVVERDGRVIGKAGLYRFPELGFIFDPEAWGNGFASEALRPVIGRAFETHGLDFITADVDPRNQASLRLLLNLGFREVGRQDRTWLIGDLWCDSVYLRLTGAEFRSTQS